MDVSLNENQLCAGLPSATNLTLPFSGEYEEDFGGPLICLEKSTQQPIFTGVASSNSLSTKVGHPGMIQKVFRHRMPLIDQIGHWQSYIFTSCNSDTFIVEIQSKPKIFEFIQEFTQIYTKTKTGFKMSQQLGLNGLNVWVRVFHQGEEFVRSTTTVMDLNTKKKNAKMPMIYVFSLFLMNCPTVSFPFNMKVTIQYFPSSIFHKKFTD